MSYQHIIRQCFKNGIILLACLFLGQSSLALSKRIDFLITHQTVNQQHLALTLTANQKFQYKIFSLTHPYRIVIDIPHGNAAQVNIPKNLQIHFLREIRKGQYQGKYLRIVFESKAKPIHAVSYLKKMGVEYSLVVALHPRTKNAATNTIKQLPLKIITTNKKQVHKKINTLRDIVIVIDPGHGGKDPGAIGYHGGREKDVVLAISKKLYRVINQRKGFKAILTRRTDHYLTLRERLSISRRYQPDLFLAIHADAYKNHHAKGASVFALSQYGATSEAARWLAAKENKSELTGGLKLSHMDGWIKSILINLSQNASIYTSLNIGRQLLKHLQSVTRLHHHRVDQAAFVVLKSPDIASLLIETGFLSNGTEEKRLKNSVYQSQLANAIDQGVYAYFKQHPSEHTWLSAAQRSTVYDVKKGDTLWKLAKKFNTSTHTLIELNRLSNTQLKIGQKLLV
jgi:N-acetylmuramoyl-L-alanine amidase